MQIKYDVVYDDGRKVTATVKPVDIMEYERRYNTSFLTLNGTTPMHHQWFMAWTSLHRSGQEPREFDVFMGDVASIEDTPNEAAPVPTKRGRSAGSSPASPSTSE